MLGFGEDGAHTTTFVVNGSGNIVQLLTNTPGGYGGHEGSLSEWKLLANNLTNIGDTAKAQIYIKEAIDLRRRYDKHDPRAIVHVDYEREFIQVAKALGMKPVKLSEELL